MERFRQKWFSVHWILSINVVINTFERNPFTVVIMEVKERELSTSSRQHEFN